MSQDNFVYDPFGNQSEAAILPAPIWPDMNEGSEWSHRLRQAKAENGPNFWSEMRAVLAHDWNTLPRHRFKAWASTWMIPLVSRYRFMHYFLMGMIKYRTDPAFYEKVLRDKGVGTLPEDFAHLAVFDDFPMTMNRLQQLGHLVCTAWDTEVKDMKRILEIGAGIGEMADVIKELGFSGTYDIYDFPELHQIQMYHHESLGMDLSKMGYLDKPEDISGEYDLVIATFSITEMPMELRDTLLAKIKTKGWLIAYSKKIFGYDNEAWMKNVFLEQHKDSKISIIDMPFHIWDGGSEYVRIS